MNKVLIVLLSLFSGGFAQRATITLLQPRMYDVSSNPLSACTVKDLSNANDLKLDNCPGGSICVEGSVTGKGRCTVFTLAEHQGATAFDYTASRVLRAETQLASDGTALSCDLANISAISDNNQKWRCLEHAVHLYLDDSESTSDYTSSCTVTYAGNIGNEMSSGTIGNVGMDSVTLASGFVADSAQKKLSCHYVPQNNKYLGYGYAQITFTKNAASLGLGEKAAKIIKVPLRFVPGNSADAGDVESSTNSPSDPDLSNAHELLSIPSSSDGIIYSSSSSQDGKLKIDYKLNVMDKRYLVNSQSGVEVLSQNAGNFNLIKEGLEIHSDYSTFYDASKNDFLNAGVNAQPLNYASYKTGNCTKRGQQAGNSLSATGCNAAGDYYGKNYAQYELVGTYEAVYGGLEHWKKGYIGCQLCSNRLAVQGFTSQSSGAQIDVGIDIDVTRLNSGCVAGSGTTCIELSNIFATTVGSGVENGRALRLPNCDSNGNNCGSAGGYDPQHAQGHVLGEFFTPELKGTIAYGDYDSEFDFLSIARLVVTDSTGKLSETGSSGLKISTACETYGKGKVYTMSKDMLTAAEDLFYNKCRIVVKDTSFAKKSKIVFFKSATDKSSCLSNATNCGSNSVYAEITQVDERRILVGDAELSLLRRKLATVEKAGAAITMSIAKYTETATDQLYFTILGTNTMMGYDAQSQECDSTKVADTLNDCDEVAVANELLFVSSAINGERKEHTIRSSPDCTGFLDVQFKDLNDTFAVYDLRIPCSRTTAKARDEVSLTYDFTLGYDLVTNLVTAKAYYLSDMNSFNVTGRDVGTSTSGLKEDLLVTVSYGYCSSANVIERRNSSGAFVGCSGTSDANGKWADQSSQNHFKSTGLNLNEWSHCAQSVEDDSANDAYIVTTKVALNYQRTLKYTSTTGSVLSTNDFCADRKFITTIKRDATATVTVATLRAPTLERAVSVTDIEWEACAGTNSFKLVISVASKQKDTTQGDATWADSNLKTVLKASSSSSVDSDSLMVNLGTMTAGQPTHTFKLQSACITVTADHCDERCQTDGSGCVAQSTASGDTSESAYSQLTHTATDLVLRGEFTNSDVDSDVNIITKYVECPLDESNVASGYLLAGATIDCDAAITTANSTTVDGKTDCTQAFTTDTGTADVKLYITDITTSGHLLTNAEASAASNANWRIRHSSIYIERYEKNFDGTTGTQLSSEEFCECGSKSTVYDASTPCQKKADRVFGLIPFSTLDCGKNASGTITYDRMKFNFLPLADATNDIFRVKFVLLAENTDLDDATTRRRRLRSITHYQVLNSRKSLSSTSSVSASASGIAFQQPSYNTADDAPAPPAAAPSAPSAPAVEPSAPVEDESVMEPDHKHTMETDTFLWIVVASIGIVLLSLGIFFGNQQWGCLDKCCCEPCRKNKDDPSSGGEVGSGPGSFAAVGFRAQRFSNLRY